MSPDELLLLCDYAEATAITSALQKELAKTHSLVVNVSDARAQFTVQGVEVRDCLAKLTPANLTDTAFGPKDFCRSRLAQVAAAFWMEDEETVHIVCFRSVAQYVFDLLKASSAQGSEVGYQ